MIPVHHVGDGQTLTRDPEALYVWAGPGGPEFGTLNALLSCSGGRPNPSEEEWARTIAEATTFGDRHQASAIYVVRRTHSAGPGQHGR